MLGVSLQGLACTIPGLPAQPHLVPFPPSPGALPHHTGLLSNPQTHLLTVMSAGMERKGKEERKLQRFGDRLGHCSFFSYGTIFLNQLALLANTLMY